MEEETKVKLTGESVSEEMKNILERLSNGLGVSQDEIEATEEMKMARTNVTHTVDTSMLENREQIRYNIFRKMRDMGAATVDEAGKHQYDGYISLDKRLDIVIGLPASGKSSAIVDTLSVEFHSRVIDNDEAKKMIPQYNDGWGAGVVHKESQAISDVVFLNAILSGENIVLPKVGSSASKLENEHISLAKENGYQVNVHYVDLDRNKALGRMLNRFIEEGRFLDPNLIEKYAPLGRGNHIAEAYVELKESPLVDGYSMWDNDVERGERPILLEHNHLTGNFIDNARTEREVSDYGKRENFTTIDSRDNGGSRRGNQQSNEILSGTSGRIGENDGGRTLQGNDEFKETLRKDFERNYTHFLVDTLGEDGERLAQNDIGNPELMKQRLNEMLDVIGSEDSSYVTGEVRAIYDRLNQQIDQFYDVPKQKDKGEVNMSERMEANENMTSTPSAEKTDNDRPQGAISEWTEIRNDSYDLKEQKIFIEAWNTEDTPDDSLGDGILIATVDIATKEVTYFNEAAKTDSYAAEVIKQTFEEIDNGDFDITLMYNALKEFNKSYSSIEEKKGLTVQECDICLRTNNLEKLFSSLNEIQDKDTRSELVSLAAEVTEQIENMAEDGDLTVTEQADNIIFSLYKNRFPESMDSRLKYVLDLYGGKDVADAIMVSTSMGVAPLSQFETVANTDNFKFRATDGSGLDYVIKAEDITFVETVFSDYYTENYPQKVQICDRESASLHNLDGENGQGVLLRYETDEPAFGYDLAIWNDEDGAVRFVFAAADDPNALDSHDNLIAMGQCPPQYESMSVLQAANWIAEDCLGITFTDIPYQVSYLSDTVSDVNIPFDDPTKLPIRAEFRDTGETKPYSVFLADEKTAESFTEQHFTHIWEDGLSVDIGARSMTDHDLDKIMESIIDTYAYGTDDHGYVSFELDMENNTVAATKFDHDLTPVTKCEVDFPDRQAFLLAVTDFSPTTFKEELPPAFGDIKSFSWINTEEFMHDVSEHEKSVRKAVEKFDSVANSAQFSIVFKDGDGKAVTEQYHFTMNTLDTLDDLSDFVAPATGIFEVRQGGEMIVKGDIDDNMRDIIEEAITEDSDSIAYDKERESLELDRPVSEKEIAHVVSEIIYAHSDKDISVDEIEADIFSQIEAAKGHPDQLDNIIKRLDNIYDNDRPSLEETIKIYSCSERLNSLKEETPKAIDREVEEREREEPAKAENSFQSVGDVLQAGLPQAEADLEIAKLLKAQGKPDDFIHSVQLMSHCEPDMASQIADAAMVTTEVQQKGFPQHNDLVTKQQNPLNKVEELEEGNYNHIDGVINNLPPKKEIKTSLREAVEQKKEVSKERSQSKQEQETEKTPQQHSSR